MLSENIFHSVRSYIDRNYVDADTYSYRIEERKRRAKLWSDDAMPVKSCALWSEEEKTESVALPEPLSLEQMLAQEDAGFTETLLKLIDKTGKKDSQIYKKANLSKQHFSKIRNNPQYRPTKPTALALAIALELSLEQTKDLIGRAGFALTNSSKFDLIVRYFIERGNYNITQINLALFEHDQSLLGA